MSAGPQHFDYDNFGACDEHKAVFIKANGCPDCPAASPGEES